jgi:hypothetical protein
VLASTVMTLPGKPSTKPSIVYQLPLAPAENGLVLRGHGHRTSIGLISNTLFWMVVALSALTVWMLLGTWRHMRAACRCRPRSSRRPTSAAPWRTRC